jgi:hypothetical protein
MICMDQNRFVAGGIKLDHSCLWERDT